MKLPKFIICLLLIATSLTSLAQKREHNLTIEVKTSAGLAVSDATVTLMQTDYSLSYGTLTLNSEGKLTVKVYAGNHRLTVEKDGYNTFTQDFNVAGAMTVTATLAEQTQMPFELKTQVKHNATTGLNDILFTWNQEEPAFFDDFEDYEAFSIQFGDWTGIDGDLLNAAPLVGEYINRGVRQYAQIINPLTVEPAWWYDYPILRPYSGQQYVGFTRTLTGAANDDWLISPTVTVGNMHSLSFMAKAADQYKEKFQVYVTTVLDDPQPSDFKKINEGNYETVDYKGWHECVYDLGDYAGQQIRFAIRYISAATQGAFMLMVDDVFVGQQFNKPQAMAIAKARRVMRSPMNPNESFRVFLNDIEQGTTEEYQWLFTNLESGEYKLGVQAVYAASQTEVAETMVNISGDNYATLTVNVTTNNGKSINGETVTLVNNATTEQVSVKITDGQAVVPSLPFGTYLLGIAVNHYNTFETTVEVAGNTTVDALVEERIVDPFNVTVDLAANEEGTQALVKWNQDLAFSDSFENYTDFEQSIFGDWRSYDLDHRNVYPIALGSLTNVVTFPGASTPSNPRSIAPIVFNPWKTTPPMLPTDEAVMAPTGDKTIAFFSPQQSTADKWLVAPALTIRDGFVCRFTAKAYAEYIESMDLCAFESESAPNPEITPYTIVSTIPQVSAGQWLRYESDLSSLNGKTVYLALHYTTFDGFFTQVDDFYVGSAEQQAHADVGDVLRYDIYLDGTFVTSVTEPQVTLTGITSGDHTVGIKAVYTSGESTTVEYTFAVESGVTTITLATTPAEVYDLNGRRLSNNDLAPGIYIIRYTDGSARKVVIK